jgi:hypothetical protein
MENEVTTKQERQKHISERSYFVQDSNAETVAKHLQSEDACKEWIMENGEVNMPYTIGYYVVFLKPVTKKAKITLQ